jgi:hypothetical protein
MEETTGGTYGAHGSVILKLILKEITKKEK